MQTRLSPVKNPRLQCNRCCKSPSSPWQGHKRAVLNALMVLFPNAINSQEFRMIASPTCWNSEEKLHFHLGIPMAIQANGVRAPGRGVNTKSPPCPILSTPGDSGRSPRATQGMTWGSLQKRGLSIWPWLSSSTLRSPPRCEGKAIGWGAGPGSLQLLPRLRSYGLFYGTLVGRVGEFSVSICTWLSVPIAHHAPASWNLQRASSQLCCLCCHQRGIPVGISVAT